MTEPTTSSPAVLLVEDDPLAADALRILFDSTGHRVRLAHTVQEAVDALASDTFDAMLLDYTLTDGSGLEVLARAPARPRIVVALTGHDDQATRRRCLDAGCRDVLVKPISIRELLARMRGWLQESSRAS